MIVVEVRPGLQLRMRADEAARFGYVEMAAKNKSQQPGGRKRTKALPEIVDEEENG
jgi:hypothetical protein